MPAATAAKGQTTLTITEAVIADIVTVLTRNRFDVTNEKLCQEQIETSLRGAFPAGVSREHRLNDRDIPDFMVGSVAVEVKIGRAPKRSMVRQVQRYAACETVSAVVLASGTAILFPPLINGKPVVVVSLGKAWL